jgi:DNA-binding response OmpR family regulator
MTGDTRRGVWLAAAERTDTVAESSGGLRVLVLDDVEEVRTLIQRALTGRGYEVDVAATLAEARSMRPAGYDAVLVDAHLGRERGIDLVETLRLEDPAAAGRCLVMTGGATDEVPDGVAYLAKPFRLDQLTDAVQALHLPGPLRMDGQQAVSAPDSGARPPASVAPDERRPPASQAPSWQLLGLTRRLRERERHELVDFLHDGPIQELTAVSLELQMMARSEPSSPCLDRAIKRLTTATGSLRWLVDGPWPFREPETRLAATLQQRTAWLLPEPVTVDADVRSASLGTAEISVIADVVELMLLGLVATNPPAQPHVAVLASEHLIEIGLTDVPVEGDRDLADDLAEATQRLEALASALGASADMRFHGARWRAQIVLRR